MLRRTRIDCPRTFDRKWDSNNIMNNIIYRPAPRWLRLWAIATVLIASVVVILGGLVTSFHVGMSDQVWPTEPWFLATNSHVWIQEPANGFLIEHTHRLAAWSIGLFAVVLAYGVWAYEPDKIAKRFGLVTLTLFLLAYLALHSEMGAAYRARVDKLPSQWPWTGTIACGIGLFLVAIASVVTIRSQSPGRWLRVVATLALTGVMIQGLLGGYRVYLNDRLGVELAAIHGAFAQVVFCLLMATVVLSAPRRLNDAASPNDRWRIGSLSTLLVGVLFAQLIWGVWMRHLGSPTAQRLHLLTAFLATGLIVWLVVRILASNETRLRFGFLAWHLLGIVAFQVYLGVEAYLGKFAAIGPQQNLPPMLRSVTIGAATLRTTHVIIGASLLAASVMLMLRAWRTPIVIDSAMSVNDDAVSVPATETAKWQPVGSA